MLDLGTLTPPALRPTGRLPEGVQITPVYDRSELIGRAIHTLTRTLIEESLIACAQRACRHPHPIGVLMAFAGMHRTTRKFSGGVFGGLCGRAGTLCAPRTC